MDSSVSAKDEIWFLRVCHHISNAVYHRPCNTEKLLTAHTAEITIEMVQPDLFHVKALAKFGLHVDNMKSSKQNKKAE